MSLLRLYKRFRWYDWVFFAFICGLTVLQVFCSMKNVDYMQGLTKAIVTLDQDAIWWNGGMMVAVAAGQFGCQVVIAILASSMTASLATRLREEVYERVSAYGLSEIDRFSTASLITRTSNDIENVQMSTLLVFRMLFSAPVTAIWAICKIQATSMELTWVAIVAVLVIVLALSAMMFFVLPKFKISQKIIDRLNQVTREGISGVRVVRAYNAEQYQNDKFEKANDDLMNLNLFTSRIMQLMNPLMTIVLDGASLGIYAVGAHLMKSLAIDYATIVAFSSLCIQIIFAFMMLLMLFVMMPRAMVCARRVDEVLRLKPSIVDPEEEVLPDPAIQGEIVFDHVSFAYEGGAHPVIADVNFAAKKGQTIAFIGETGSGKTSLVNLVARLYDVTEGAVLVDGVNVKDMKQATLRKKIGFVPQKANLFAGTVRENIGFGLDEMDEDTMRKAAETACASEFIEKMPEGYESHIAAGGTNVSGGQRQRLCIARACAIDPEIFVFDDSFSALDFKTDKAVRENLAKAYPNATKLIVAQRVGTIMDADLILVLSEGKVVGQGTHRELLSTCETYRDIALSQLSKEELGL